jgi:hypothetical protein
MIPRKPGPPLPFPKEETETQKEKGLALITFLGVISFTYGAKITPGQ